MIRVGVLRGGTSTKYDESLASGAYILKNLSRDRYEPVDVFVDTEGVWHIGGKPVSHEAIRRRIDVAWNSLHGFYGSDGKVAQELEALSIPYVGSGPLSSAVTMHKKFAKDRLSEIGLKTPRGIYIESWGNGGKEETVASVVASVSRDFSPPWLVEPISRGHHVEQVRAKTRHELSDILGALFDHSMPVLVEEEVFGTRASVMCVPGFRGQDIYTFLPHGIQTGRGSAAEALQEAARKVHHGMSLGHYSLIEAIVTPKGQIYVTNVDTVPSFALGSEIHSALERVGSSFKELSDHILFSTLRKRA